MGVVGKVGSGKSSLLSAILAEMNRDAGSIQAACLDEVMDLLFKLKLRTYKVLIHKMNVFLKTSRHLRISWFKTYTCINIVQG